MFRLGHHRLSKLELVDELYKKGYSSKEISEYLNHHNIKTPKGLDYYTNSERVQRARLPTGLFHLGVE